MVTEQDGGAPGEAVGDTVGDPLREITATEPMPAAVETDDDAGSADGTAPEQEDVFEGPRRRASRERAERRAAQERAMAIEQARREAKRRARGRAAVTAKPVPRGAVRGLKMVLATVGLTVLTVALGLVLYFTPAMSARSIIVTGIGAVTRDQVLDAAQVRLGTPLLQINTDQVADRVAAIRRVASARVQRQYPSALRITIVERVPVVVKEFPDGPHLYDRDGVDFATAPPPPALALHRRRQSRADRPADQGRARGAVGAAARGRRTGGPDCRAVGRIDHLDAHRWAHGDLGDQRPHRGEGREAGGPVDPAGPDLRRVQSGPAHRQIAKIAAKFARRASARLHR